MPRRGWAATLGSRRSAAIVFRGPLKRTATFGQTIYRTILHTQSPSENSRLIASSMLR